MAASASDLKKPEFLSHAAGSGNEGPISTEPPPSAGNDTRARNDFWKNALAPIVKDPFSGKKQRDRSQANVDEYLEYLQRRYDRLHCDDEVSEQNTQPSKQFSVMDWLRQGPDGAFATDGNDGNAAREEQHQNDALHVLGLAGLASKRLLNKNRRMRPLAASSRMRPPTEKAPQERQGQTTVVEARYSTQTTDEDPGAAVSSRPSSSSSLFRSLAQRRNRILDYQTRLHRGTVCFLTRIAILASNRSSKALWKSWSRGKRRVVWTLTVAAVLTFSLLRILAQVFLQEAATGIQ